MNYVKEWKALNWELLAICERICESMKPHAAKDMFANISLGFILKATRTLKAINILYNNDLAEPAQVLVRILFELRLIFDCFLTMAKKDSRDACKRVADSMILEKTKQMKASAFAGVPDDVRKNYEEFEKEIEGHYDKQEFKRIRAHGFTGLSVEQRASFTGHEQAYNIIYRNFSRNIHSTDYVENCFPQDETIWGEYIESRDLASLYTAHFSAGGIAEYANHVFQCGFDSELHAIGLKQEALRQRQTPKK